MTAGRGTPALPTLAIQRSVPLLIVGGLAIDMSGGAWGQPVVVVATWALYLWFLRGLGAGGRTMMVLCLLYATVGEVLLSLVWRVYDYRLGNLPLFVPPGHVLLFLLGLTIAPHLSTRLVRTIAMAAAVAATALALSGRDTFSAVLVAVFLASVWLGRERHLYATMFVLALLMELYGTWLGNWTWHPRVGTTGLVTLNPPMAAGAFYCALDLLVMQSMRLVRSRHPAIAPPVHPMHL